MTTHAMDYVRHSSFTSEVENLMKQYHVPGLSIAVVQGDQVFSNGYGHASLETSTPCTADTLFDIASCAKSMTAASVALLIDDNDNYPDIQYEARMSHLLPEDFVMADSEYTEGITVEDILSHRTGMAPHDNSYFGTQAEHPDDARSITRNLRNLAIAAPIRSRYIYCNMMYTVVTHLIEVKTQQSFSGFLHDRLFLPLNMNSTCLQPGRARSNGLGDRIATGYIWTKNTSYSGLQSPDCPEGQGAGSVMSSANDMIKWVQALIHQDGPITQKIYQGLVRLRSFPYQHPARIKPYTSPTIYAAGLDVYYYRGYMIVGHSGVIPGFSSRFVFSPDLKLGAVFLGNSGGAGSVSTFLVRKLIDSVLGVTMSEQGGNCKPSKDVQTAQGKDAGKKKRNKKLQRQDDRQSKPNDTRGQKADRQNRQSPSEAQEKPLELYTGKYRNAGYRGMEVQIKDGELFIDATDRSMGFTLRFVHVRDQTKYTAYLTDAIEGGDDPLDAEFVFEDGAVTRMGLRLEQALSGLIWFDRPEATHGGG